MNIQPSAAIEAGSSPVAADPLALASVLVIDDEEVVGRFLSVLLKAEGFDVVIARSGEEGVKLLRARQFEVAIADLVMSGMDGIQTLTALKKVDPDIEVIILTGFATVESTIAALRQGACDFLLKPVGRAQLRPALLRALDIRRPKAALPMYEDSRALLATLNREDLVPAILTLAQRTMRASAAALAQLPAEGTDLRVALTDGHGPFTEAAAESLAQIAMRAGEALRDAALADAHPRNSDARVPAGSVLSYPLEVRNAMLGSLVLWREQNVAKFSGFDVQRGRLLADEIVIALDNARLYRELAHKVEELQTAKGDFARAEARARAVIETAREAIILSDRDGVVREFNPSAEHTFGWSREQAVGGKLVDFAIPPRLLDAFRKHLETAYQAGKDPLNGCLEISALRQNGEEFPFEISTALIDTPQGKLLSTFGRDITERMQAEERLRVSEERYREVFENASDIVYTTDLDARMTSLNRVGQQTLGYSAEEAIELNLRQLVGPKHWNIVQQGRERLLAGDRDVTSELEVTAKDGRRVVLEAKPRLIYEDGRPVGVQAIARDVTGRDVAEMELRHAQKLESVGRLASGIAHEINTPIQFVGDNTHFLQDSFGGLQTFLGMYRQLHEAAKSGAISQELLKQVRDAEEACDSDYLAEEIPRALAQSLDGVTRVATIVRAMKEFAHPEGKAMAGADLNKALLSTLTVARNELKYVADVETDFGDLPPVVCNIGDLNQVFLNLLVNAAHAIADVVKGSEKKGTIRVRTVAEGKAVLIAISDTGAGIPEGIRNRIYDPFFTTKEVGRGTGQGLAIARSVVVGRHKGTLTFESAVGKGTTFYIHLPVDSGEQSKEAKLP